MHQITCLGWIKFGSIECGGRVIQSVWVRMIQLGKSMWAIPMVEKVDETGSGLGGTPDCLRDMELANLSTKPGCLEFLTKAGLDRKPVVTPLMI